MLNVQVRDVQTVVRDSVITTQLVTELRYAQEIVVKENSVALLTIVQIVTWINVMCVQIPVHVSSVTRITISETTTDVLRPLTVKGVQQLPQPEMEFKSAKHAMFRTARDVSRLTQIDARSANI
ncbi:uncharacterized protein LOC143071445 [Mytilus galloprovincialis]|uniref:uncharacterized protein LOC143071445 n=1 Tax=Mytilus galloprovincialis TaxID=29158 RepID=UPI003F7BB900